MSQSRNHHPARDRIIDIEIMKLERRTASEATRSVRPSQRDMVIASLLCRPDADGRDALRRLFGSC